MVLSQTIDVRRPRGIGSEGERGGPPDLPARRGAAARLGQRVRGHRRAAGDRHPARRLHRRRAAPARARARRAARRQPQHPARGHRRAARLRARRHPARSRRRHGHHLRRARARAPGAAPVRTGAALADAMDFRRVVEPGAAALAATRSLAADQRAWLLESARAAREAPDNAAHRLADSRFHLAVATLSGSPDAHRGGDPGPGRRCTSCSVRSRCCAATSSTPTTSTTPSSRAILAGDADAARAVMEEHCDATSALLRGLLG